MKILDTFVQKNQDQGVATPEMPSDGAKSADIQSILSNMSGLFGEAAAAVNSFQGAVQGGKAVQKPVVKEVAATPAPAAPSKWPWIVGGLALVVGAWLYFRNR